MRDWDAVRAASDIQFAPLAATPPPAPKPPGWLAQLGEWLAKLFQPLGEFLGFGWPVFSKVLLGVAVIAALAIAWRVLGPVLRQARTAAPAEPEWTPDRAEALALLEDADRLAAEGRYDEATHLLLRRSVGQIAQAKPDWIGAASTAREIAALPALPQAARGAFATIARAVERSRYALSALGAEDWNAAREAYAAFALQRLSAA